jgi:hypothetical protein
MESLRDVSEISSKAQSVPGTCEPNCVVFCEAHMESQQDHYQAQEGREILFSEKVIFYVLLTIGLLVLLGFLLFRTTSTELTCSRSSLKSIECSLVRTTLLSRRSPIQVIDPLAVDVISHRYKSTVYSYSAEIRSAHSSRILPILSTHNYNSAQDAANKVNDFLLRSEAASFVGRFPEKIQ